MVGRLQSGTRDSLISRKNKAVLIPRHDRPVAQFPDVVQPVFQLRMIPVIRGNTVPYFPHPLFILYFRNKHAERTVPQVQALALVFAGPPRLKSQINTLIRRTGQGKGGGGMPSSGGRTVLGRPPSPRLRDTPACRCRPPATTELRYSSSYWSWLEIFLKRHIRRRRHPPMRTRTPL